MTKRVRFAPAVLAALATTAALLTGCSSTTGSAHWNSGGPTGTGSTVSPGTTSGPAKVAVVPATKAKDVAPGSPVRVNATGATTVTSVTLTAGSKSVAGAIAADGHSWTSTGKLSFGTKYTVKVVAAGIAPMTSTFTTASPNHTIQPILQENGYALLRDGGTYGVGEPIIVHFSHPVSDREAAVKALTVTSTPAVEGRWHWINSTNAHYRPEKYWATGTTITVRASVYGVKLGSGTYGSSNASATIHIGESHVAIADAKTHHMKVYVDGAMVRDIPVSLGMGGSTKGDNGQVVDFWTRSGPHVVILKSLTHYMASDTFGLSDPSSKYYYAPVLIKDTVRISYAGEFVHLRTWSLSQIGHRNTSHGCINVGPKDAKWIYDLLIPGDVVDVTGTPKTLPLTDGLGDWTIPWSQW